MGHLEWAAILDFGQRKNGNQLFLNPHVARILVKNEIAINRHIAKMFCISTVTCTTSLLLSN